MTATTARPDLGAHRDTQTPWASAPTRTISVDGVDFAYRELGPATGVPVILLTHLAAVLDNWDPRVVDGIAAHHRVIAFDNRGVGASGGSTPTTIEAMAHDEVAFIRALGLEQVDLLGFSMGGMIAQLIAAAEPQLVRKVILAGTGPAGGVGITKVTRLSHLDTLRGLFTLQDPKQYLFFTRTPEGRRAGQEFLARLKERTVDRDTRISVRSYLAQLKAIHRWGQESPADLSLIRQSVLVANGETDRMVPTSNSHDLAQRLPDADLVIYPDAGHGGIFQFHQQFVERALAFLGGNPVNVEGATALVTGANRGLGAAIAQALVDAGAKVYGAARDHTTIANPDVIPVRLDVTSPDDIANAARACGDVSIVVNNAGIGRSSSSLASDAADAARAELETNYFGPMRMAQAFAPVLRDNGGGALVNVLSVLSFIAMPQAATYSASKAAAWSLTNALRMEARQQGTLVVAVHAGFIDTDMAAGIDAEKISPQSVATQITAAIEAGAEEVLADATSEMVKASLSNDLTTLYPTLQAQWDAVAVDR